MALLPFDELNTPKVEVEPPEQYFSKMAISKEQKEERVETANDLMDVLLFFFALLAIEMESVSPDYDMVYRKFKKRFRDVVADHSRMDDYQNNYVDEYTLQQYELTRRHMEAAGVGSGNTDAGWWTSADRAMAIGENAANIILNHEELLQAAEAGAVGKKWIDKADNRVRKTHLAVTKKIIPLEEYFVVGDGIMLFPCDWDNNPDECYNCRCSCQYFDKDGNKVSIRKENTKDENEPYTIANEYGIINNNPVYRSLGDPMREVTGSAFDSNPKEVESFIEELKTSGVEIRWKSGVEDAMGYSPGISAGEPGQFYIQREASYSAWLHEMKHMRDDRSAGWRGLVASMSNRRLRYRMEKEAYQIEIDLAKKAGRPDIVKRLRNNLKMERKRIYGETV